MDEPIAVLTREAKPGRMFAGVPQRRELRRLGRYAAMHGLFKHPQIVRVTVEYRDGSRMQWKRSKPAGDARNVATNTPGGE